VSGQLHTQARLPPGKEPPVPIECEAGWATEPVWTLWRRGKYLAPVDNRTPADHPVAPLLYLLSYPGCHNHAFTFPLFRMSLRQCATSRKVTGDIPVEVTGIFNWPDPSSLTIGPGLIQPLTEMSARNLPWGKSATGLDVSQPNKPPRPVTGIGLPFFLK
jgi:hypothetical protein